jgi:hypothetical protein
MSESNILTTDQFLRSMTKEYPQLMSAIKDEWNKKYGKEYSTPARIQYTVDSVRRVTEFGSVLHLGSNNFYFMLKELYAHVKENEDKISYWLL